MPLMSFLPPPAPEDNRLFQSPPASETFIRFKSPKSTSKNEELRRLPPGLVFSVASDLPPTGKCKLMSFSSLRCSFVRSIRTDELAPSLACFRKERNSSVRGRYMPFGWKPGRYGADGRGGGGVTIEDGLGSGGAVDEGETAGDG